MEKVPGVIKVVSGYAGGTEPNPTYEQVSTGTTGYREAVQVHFDPAVVGFADILDFFWKSFDPTDAGGSFGDRGFQYTSAIFVHSEAQQRVVEASRKALAGSGRLDGPVVTPVLPFTTFYEAEAYHQNYSKTCPLKYKTYRQFLRAGPVHREDLGQGCRRKRGRWLPKRSCLPSRMTRL